MEPRPSLASVQSPPPLAPPSALSWTLRQAPPPSPPRQAPPPLRAATSARANPARPATTAPTAGRKGGSARRSVGTAEEEELKHLLRSHNSKFAAAKTLYEPRTQSVAAMREWERRSGRSYASLSVEERVQANQEINAGCGSSIAIP